MSSFLRSFLPLNYSKRFEFHSDLSIEECVKKLAANIGPESVLNLAIYHEVRGIIAGNRFRIRRGYGRNSWRVSFNGELIAEGKGTRIEVHAEIPEYVEPFASCMSIIVVFWATAGLAWAIFDFSTKWYLHGIPVSLLLEKLPALLLPIVALFFHSFHLLGQGSIPDQEASLITLLQKHLQAKLIS